MHPPHFYTRAQELRAAGVAFGDICRELGLPRGTVAHWLYGDRAEKRRADPRRAGRCPRCASRPGPPDDAASYAYLLGLYLGDGHLVTRARVPVLRITCTASWPRLIELCEEAMLATLATTTQRVPKPGCVNVQSYSNHWPCMLPQHGPGRKHERRIELMEWQKPVVEKCTGHFLRGLIHSDGCRATNTIKKNGRTYTYPRYHFSNESADIMRLCQESLDRLDISWTMCKPNLLSVARREAVAALDVHVGPKS
jgi:hypothetical protein